MREQHYAYKIIPGDHQVVCSPAPIIELKMLDLLNKIHMDRMGGIYWVFKKLDGSAAEPLCIVDCDNNRIYYHFSGLVDDLDETITKLNH